MKDVYSKRVYNIACHELEGVKWEGCPYDIREGMIDLLLRYFPDGKREELAHDVDWAIANSLGDGCEIETN